MAAEPHPAAPAPTEPNHARRFGAIWIVASLIATPLVVVLLGPIMPPGNGSEQASGHVTDNTVLLAMATPVLLLVVIYLIYAIIYFRQPRGAALEGPAVRGELARADHLDRRHLLAGAVAGGIRHGAPGRRRRRLGQAGRTRWSSPAGRSCPCR